MSLEDLSRVLFKLVMKRLITWPEASEAMTLAKSRRHPRCYGNP